MCSFICSGPVAQLRPSTSIAKGSRIATTAAMSEPTSIVPVVSIVTDTMIGRRWPLAAKASSIPCRAALICSTSWQVSTMNRSTSPAISPSACSRKEARRVSKSMWPRVGSLVVGPIEPATKRGFWGVLQASATSRASSAARLLIAKACSSSPYSASTTEAAPKVSVSITSQPTSRNWRCTACTASGRVNTRFSLQPSRAGPPKSSAVRAICWSEVPVAPSNTSTGR